MLNRLADFIYRDYRARWRAFNWTLAIICLYGFVCNSILSRPLKAVSVEALALTGLSMFGWIWRYVRIPAPRPTEGAVLRTRAALRYGLALGGFVALAVVGQPVTTLEAAIVDRRLRRLLTGRLDAPRLKLGSSAAQLAKELKLDVPTDVVSAGGLKALNVAKSGPDLAPVAWQTTLAYAALSTLNVPRIPGTRRREIGPFRFIIHFIHEPSAPVGSAVWGLFWTYGDDVPIAEAARFEVIGSSENSEYRSGPRTVIINPMQYGIIIDDMWMRNATVQNTVVAYSGGPIRLENVRFINCDFRMPNVSTTQELARLLLTATSISLQAGHQTNQNSLPRASPR